MFRQNRSRICIIHKTLYYISIVRTYLFTKSICNFREKMLFNIKQGIKRVLNWEVCNLKHKLKDGWHYLAYLYFVQLLSYGSCDDPFEFQCAVISCDVWSREMFGNRSKQSVHDRMPREVHCRRISVGRTRLIRLQLIFKFKMAITKQMTRVFY